MGLNAPQRNSLAVTLRQVEKALASVEDLMHQPDGVLYQATCSVQPEDRGALVVLIVKARAEIEALAREFRLDKRSERSEQQMAAVLSSAWSSVEEARPAKLRRYGETDPSLEQSLGPSVERLAALLLAAISLVKGSAKSSGQSP